MTSLFFSLALLLFNLQVKTWGKKLWSTLRASESRNLSKITCLRVIHKSFFSQIISINLFFFLHHANWVPLSPSLSHWWPRFQYCAAASPDTYIHAPWHTPLPRKHVLLITRLKRTWWGKKNPQKTDGPREEPVTKTTRIYKSIPHLRYVCRGMSTSWWARCCTAARCWMERMTKNTCTSCLEQGSGFAVHSAVYCSASERQLVSFPFNFL